MIDTATLYRMVAVETGIPIQDVRLVIQTLTRHMRETLLAEGGFLLRGFGQFQVSLQTRNVRHRAQKHRRGLYVQVSFKKAKALRQLLREYHQRTGKTVEKYGVDEGQDEGEAKKLASANCPKCGEKVEHHGKTTWCPKCGTEPFESK